MIQNSEPQSSESTAQQNFRLAFVQCGVVPGVDYNFESEHTKMINEKIREHIAIAKQRDRSLQGGEWEDQKA